MKNTIVHDNSKHKTIHHLRPPGSSIDGAASNVVRYQKYVVADLHSSASVPFNGGHDSHGNVN